MTVEQGVAEKAVNFSDTCEHGSPTVPDSLSCARLAYEFLSSDDLYKHDTSV